MPYRPSLLVPERRPLWKPDGPLTLDRSHPLARKLVQAFLFTEGAGKASDLVKPSQKVTLNSGASWVRTQYGPALHFNGAGNATMSQGFTPSGSSWSVEMQVRVVALPATGAFGSLLVVGTTDGLYVVNNNGGNNGWDIDSTTGDVSDGALPNTNAWYHVVFAYDGTTGFVYSNGKLDNSGAISNFTYGWNLLGAETGNASAFTGDIAWLRIWDGRVLTANEARTLARDPFAMVRSLPDELRTFAILATPPAGGSTPVTLSDSATGTQSLAVTATVPSSETGAGTDAVTLATVTITLPTDTAGGSDAQTVTASVPLAETGAGSETQTVTATAPLTETGTGSEALASTAAVPLAETSTGTETLAITATIPIADVANGSDAFTLGPVTIALAEIGAGSDNSVAVTATIPLAETGTGSESFLSGSGTPKPVSDTAGGSEALALATISVPLPDSAAVLDAITVTATGVPLGPETATGNEALSFSALTLTLTDTATGNELSSYQVTFSQNEIALGVDAVAVASVAVALPADAGAGSDTATVIHIGITNLSLSDAGASTDTVRYTPVEYARATLYALDGVGQLYALDAKATLYMLDGSGHLYTLDGKATLYMQDAKGTIVTNTN